ncbi:condensation domain-containing protein [Candidatus Leptofilum sp.]|uniref:condensation domain-containing protein n=1 Tax=Candidatus Leptofilum sp. TaxID=3241576 RepID=UPI003B590F98
MQAGTAVTSDTIAEFNLTDLQRLYWIGHQLRPSATHFNNAFSFTFHTSLCPDLFAQAFDVTVCEYDALRTVFIKTDERVQQQILPEPPAQLRFVDLSQEPDPIAAAKQWQGAEVKRPFTPEHRLYNTALLKLTESHFVWFLNQHHLITDASSFFLIASAVLAHYEALQLGTPQPLAKKPTFARYAASLQRQQQSSRAAASRAFWQEMVAEKPEPLTFYGRSHHKITQNSSRWTQNLGSETTAQLIAAAEAVDLGSVTTEFRQFCLTAALFFGLLHQLTRQTKLGLVTTVHNRATQVNRQTVGVLMELCPVVVTIDQKETIPTLMQKVAEVMKPLLLHYRYGASQTAVDMALETMFTFVQRPSLTFNGQPVTHEIVHHNSSSESVALHVHHLEDDNSYQLYLDLHEDVFSEAQMTHAQRSLQALISAALSNPQQTISQLALPWPEEEEVGLSTAVQPQFVPPSTLTEGVLQHIWQELLARSPIGVEDDFFALGGGSWQAMAFLSRLEAETGHYLPLSTLISHRTIAQLAQQIDKAAHAEAVFQIQTGDPALTPLFLVPGAAGNTLAMQRLAQNLSPQQPVYTFEMPSLDVDNLPAANVPELAQYYLQAIQSVQSEGPYHLAGYSAGGILAYEVAQQLQQQGQAVDTLAIIDMPAPNPAWAYWWQLCHFLAKPMHVSADREEAIYLFGRDCWSRATFFSVLGLRMWLKRYGRRALRFWQMPRQQKWERLQNKLNRRAANHESATANAILQDMDPSSLTEPRARTLFYLYDRAVRAYLPKPYAGSVLLLRCLLGYGRKEIRSPYPDYGWGKLVHQLETQVIQANGHLALMQMPAVHQVGQILQKSLQKERITCP